MKTLLALLDISQLSLKGDNDMTILQSWTTGSYSQPSFCKFPCTCESVTCCVSFLWRIVLAPTHVLCFMPLRINVLD